MSHISDYPAFLHLPSVLGRRRVSILRLRTLCCNWFCLRIQHMNGLLAGRLVSARAGRLAGFGLGSKARVISGKQQPGSPPRVLHPAAEVPTEPKFSAQQLCTHINRTFFCFGGHIAFFDLISSRVFVSCARTMLTLLLPALARRHAFRKCVRQLWKNSHPLIR